MFQCCGYNSTTDRAVPPRYDGDAEVCTSTLGYNVPCHDQVLATLTSSALAAGGTAIAIAIIQIVCLIFSCYLFVKIPRNRDDDVLLDEATR